MVYILSTRFQASDVVITGRYRSGDNRLVIKNKVTIVPFENEDALLNSIVYLVWAVPEKRSRPAVEVLSIECPRHGVSAKVYKSIAELSADKPVSIDRAEDIMWIGMYDQVRSYTANGKWALIMATIVLTGPRAELEIEYISYHDESHTWMFPTLVSDCSSPLQGRVNLSVHAFGFPKLDVKYRDSRDGRWEVQCSKAGETSMTIKNIEKLQTRNILFDSGEYASSSEDEELTELLSKYGFKGTLSSEYERPNVLSGLSRPA